mgnify:FL=1
MKIHQLYRQQTLNLSVEEAWKFFSSPYFLNEITPDFFHVEIESKVPDEIYAGLLISYRMKAVFGYPMDWLSEVSQCETHRYFIYQQQEGPFKFWSHEVRLTATPTGTQVEDIVFYTMPGWLFGELLHTLIIGKRLQAIFDTRQAYLQQRWA